MIIVKKGSWSWSGGLIVMGLKAILRNSWNWFNLVRKCFSREKYPLYSLVPINQGQPHGDSWLNRAFRYFRRKHTHVEQTCPLPWPSPSQWHRQVVGCSTSLRATSYPEPGPELLCCLLGLQARESWLVIHLLPPQPPAISHFFLTISPLKILELESIRKINLSLWHSFWAHNISLVCR